MPPAGAGAGAALSAPIRSALCPSPTRRHPGGSPSLSDPPPPPSAALLLLPPWRLEQAAKAAKAEAKEAKEAAKAEKEAGPKKAQTAYMIFSGESRARIKEVRRIRWKQPPPPPPPVVACTRNQQPPPVVAYTHAQPAAAARGRIHARATSRRRPCRCVARAAVALASPPARATGCVRPLAVRPHTSAHAGEPLLQGES